MFDDKLINAYKASCKKEFNNSVKGQCHSKKNRNFDVENLCWVNTESKKSGASIVEIPNIEGYEQSFQTNLLVAVNNIFDASITTDGLSNSLSPKSSPVSSTYVYLIAPKELAEDNSKVVRTTIKKVEKEILEDYFKCLHNPNKAKCLRTHFAKAFTSEIESEFSGKEISVFYVLNTHVNPKHGAKLGYKVCCFEHNSHKIDEKTMTVTPPGMVTPENFSEFDFYQIVEKKVADGQNDLMVIGYTDHIGSDLHNLGLGWRRAKTIVDLLCKKKVIKACNIKKGDKPKIKAIVASCGEQNPYDDKSVEIFYPANVHNISRNSCFSLKK